MNTLLDMPNIGPELTQQLMRIGIETPEQLKQVGSKEAWLRIQQIDISACCNRLMALEGANQNIRWHNLTPEIKNELKAFYQKHKLT